MTYAQRWWILIAALCLIGGGMLMDGGEPWTACALFCVAVISGCCVVYEDGK